MRRAQRGRRAAGPVLPEDLIVWEILVRLPAKAILRCRAVCRSWRRLTSDPAFLLAHHQHQPSLPLVTFHGKLPDPSVRSRAVVDASLDTLDLRRPPSQRQPVLHFTDYNYRRGFCIYTSCDGLLLLSLSNKNFYLCNPATRQWIPLPRLAGVDGAALYRHTASGVYRIIYWKGRYTPDRKVVYHVITVGSSAEPRRIEASTTSAKRFVETGWFHVTRSSAVLLHSCLHWLVHGEIDEVIVVFDTVVESFRSMPSPIAADMKRPQLLKMGATLAVSWIDKNQTVMKLWVLRDYETGRWSLKRRVLLPVLEIWCISRWRFFGTVVSEEGDVLREMCC